MCGIAGLIKLDGVGRTPPNILSSMAETIFRRGPDEEGYFETPEVGLASRRLSIVGLADGRQPIFNEDRSVAVVFNGELFDYPEMRQMLKGRGHRFATHSDTEIIPHLWEDHGESMFDHLRGQFAIALWDARKQQLVLGRDRFGICPLYWTRQRVGDAEWLLFASEIKALLASEMVPARPDVRGIHHVFNFFALPGSVTCFEGINLLLPGHYLRIRLQPSRDGAEVVNRKYWEIDFPDLGDEERGDDPNKLVGNLEQVLFNAVERRFRADVPVVSYLSGGIDSSMVVALAAKVLGRPVPTFTIRILDPKLDETGQAAVVSRHLQAEPVVVDCGDAEVIDTYPRLTFAAEGPVVDTSCTALLLLAQEVHRRGYKVALTGEGSDEWFGGYPWFKLHKGVCFLDSIPGLPLGETIRRFYFSLAVGATRDFWKYHDRCVRATGGRNACHEIYSLMALSRFRFFSQQMQQSVGDHIPYRDLDANLDRVRRWHPFNQALYWGARIHLGGHLLSLKGDRISMHSSVEMRYPYLDEELFGFLARLHPRWKLRGMTDKYLLRLLGDRWLPKSTAWAPKGMFRAPLDSFFPTQAPLYVDELLSDESLAKTGYFDIRAVRYWRQQVGRLRKGLHKRTSVELGLAGVVATQMWHHMYIDSSLASLPSWREVAAKQQRFVPAATA